MNKKFAYTAIVLVALSTGTSFAATQPASGEFATPVDVAALSTVTRAEVRAQLLNAAKKGALAANGEISEVATDANTTAGRTRAEVSAEARSMKGVHVSGEFAI